MVRLLVFDAFGMTSFVYLAVVAESTDVMLLDAFVSFLDRANRLNHRLFFVIAMLLLQDLNALT